MEGQERGPVGQENEWSSAATRVGREEIISRKYLGSLPGTSAVTLTKMPNSGDTECEEATSCSQAGSPGVA